MIRPERVRLSSSTMTGPNSVPGKVERAVYLGNATQLAVRLDDDLDVQALIQNTGDELGFGPGDDVSVHLPADALQVLERAAAVERQMPRVARGRRAGRAPAVPQALRDERRRRFPIGSP